MPETNSLQNPGQIVTVNAKQMLCIGSQANIAFFHRIEVTNIEIRNTRGIVEVWPSETGADDRRR